ncbi:hypothetical protein [uncultured Desulfovibrio sp.]|uniref:hypothetical protein n=1 Tax=uncultured Desulfovibrio sp. TaxID=167968 RepID=UPI0026062679|nr:hypothetical protein [uncultured Desulfovibrio sp.]
MQIAVHPNVYKTGQISGLLSALESAWVRGHTPGDGNFFAISGFANYNGGVRFYDVFKRHIDNGGRVFSIFGGSTSQRLTSKQVVAKMLACGAEVRIVNRKRILHMKCYGAKTSRGQNLVISSGNFTGPGMSQNVEMSIFVDEPNSSNCGFSWDSLFNNIYQQRWGIYTPNLQDLDDPAWSLLYDEQERTITLNDTDEVSLILTLSHADTARIMAYPGATEGLGSQYFWLSKDCFDFFPPLTILNTRGVKSTYSCLITLNYIDLKLSIPKTRVTFEAENNLDFRLGTGALRYTRLAQQGDLAVISRISEDEYDLRIFKIGTSIYELLLTYAPTFIGHQGKQYGYIPNQQLANILRVPIGRLQPRSVLS